MSDKEIVEQVPQANLGTPENPIIETSADTAAVEPEPKLSRRDALEVAIAVDQEKNGASTKEAKRDSNRDRANHSSKQSRDAGSRSAVDAAPVNEPPPLQPPAQWEKEEKELFMQSSRAQQEATLKLHEKRAAYHKRIEEERQALAKEREQYDSEKKLVEDLRPYINARGLKEDPRVAVQKAIAMYQEFATDDEGKARKAAADYLTAKGIPVPDGLLTPEQKEAKVANEQITPLQQRLEQLERERAEEKQAVLTQQIRGSWTTFETRKNAAGSSLFPDLNNSESGLKLASSIGSLVHGSGELSKQFAANVLSRYPDADLPKIYEEAYKYYGGRIDNTQQQAKPPTSQEQINKSKRAAASVPGKGSSSGTVTPKKLSRREALALAIEEDREREQFG